MALIRAHTSAKASDVARLLRLPSPGNIISSHVEYGGGGGGVVGLLVVLI